jgi:hypothetical protein
MDCPPHVKMICVEQDRDTGQPKRVLPCTSIHWCRDGVFVVVKDKEGRAVDSDPLAAEIDELVTKMENKSDRQD